MNKPLFLFVGKSGSGKTTIGNYLSEYKGYKQVQSYTTRLPRFKGEEGHIFVDENEFNCLDGLVAYTEYNNNKYGVTAQMVDEADIYVLDVPGVETLLKQYNTHRPIYIFYFDATVHTRINRMIERGDHDNAIISRLLEDEKDDWLRQLEDMPVCTTKDIRLYIINANKNLDGVLKSISWYIE